MPNGEVDATHRRAVEGIIRNRHGKMSVEPAVDALTVDPSEPSTYRSIESRLWWLGA
jgi:hypothetical protein